MRQNVSERKPLFVTNHKYSLNDQETDTVRLDASTIKQLFEDTDYKLDDVRKKKLVIYALSHNSKSIRAIKKSGFKFVCSIIFWSLFDCRPPQSSIWKLTDYDRYIRNN